MRKTSIYLSDDEAEGLRRLASATGRSQADLIREGVRSVLTGEDADRRVFHSMGKGRGGGRPYAPWASDRLYRKVVGG
jgi:hypothetical protein